MGDKIKEVKAHIVEVPLVGEWKISLYAAKTRRHAVVTLVTEDGVIGYGEASPSPAFMGETADTIKTVVDMYLANAIKGLEINDLQKIHDCMDKAIYGNTAAKSAIDIAVHDALAKSLGEPIYFLLGGLQREKVPLTYVVGLKNLDDAYEEAIKYIEAGFSTIKIKVGMEIDRDLLLVRKIWKAIEDSKRPVKLRLDANQGYDVPTALKLIRTIESEGEIESIEQPIPKWNLMGLKEIRDKISTPIMLDETIFNFHDMVMAIKLGIGDIVNLKICKVGGLFQAHKIAAMAEAAGMKCTVGSNLELGVGIAASLHFAASHPVVSYPCDFICGVFLHEKDLIQENIKEYILAGHMIVKNQPGLGVTFVK
jgi:o-succinylbenzoate synthase